MPLQSTELKLHTDRIAFGGKILYQDDKITVVPCVLMAEGVQNGALKPFEEFYDPEGLEGALWAEGVPIPREHPASYVSHLTRKIGKIRNVQFDVDGRRVTAEAVLFNGRLTPDEMKSIEAGEMLGGSIGFWCNDEPLDEPQIWTDGEQYDTIQRGPFFIDHFALVADPACPVGVCGFNVNSANNDCKCKKQKEVNKLPDESKPAAGVQPVTEGQKPPAGDPKPPEGNAKAPEAKPQGAPRKDAMDPTELLIRAKAILEMSDDYSKRNEALNLLLEIVTEGSSTAPAGNSKPQNKTVVEMDSNLSDRLSQLETKINSQAQEITGLKEDNRILKEEKKTREDALKTEQDEKTKNALKANFDQAYQMEFDKHWPVIQKDGINAFLANPEHAKHWDLKGDKKKIVPVGQEFALHGDGVVDGVGIASVDSLTKKFYPGAKAPEKKEGQ